MAVEGRSLSDLVIAELQQRVSSGQQSAKAFFPLRELRANGFAIEMKEIEQEERQSVATGVRRILDQAEGGPAVGPDPAQLAIEISLTGRKRRHRSGYRGIFMRPVDAGAGQQSDRALVQPRMHTVAVEFDFVQPLGTFRRLLHKLGELGLYPGRHRSWLALAPSRERELHIVRRFARAGGRPTASC